MKVPRILVAWFVVVAIVSTVGACVGKSSASKRDPAPDVAAAADDAADDDDARAAAIANGCSSCHAEHTRFWRYGAHVSLSCAECHGVEDDHTQTGTKPERPENRSCLGCHTLVPSGEGQWSDAEILERHLRRVETMHKVEVDRKKVKNRCVSCHDPHLAQ